MQNHECKLYFAFPAYIALFSRMAIAHNAHAHAVFMVDLMWPARTHSDAGDTQGYRAAGARRLKCARRGWGVIVCANYARI